MAELVKLIELDINMNDVISDTIELKKELAALKETTKQFVTEEDKMTEAYIQNQAAIKATNELIRKNETITKNVIKANKQNTDSIAQMEAQLAAVTAEWSKYSAAEIKENKDAIALNERKTELTATLKELKKATGDHRMEVGNYAIANVNLKKELKELKQAMYSMQEGTAEYTAAMRRAVEIQEMFDDTNERIKGRMTGLEDVMGNVVKVGSGVASAFEAAQGAAALFGEENEDLQKAMVKVQASIALANGLQGLEGMGKAFKNLLMQIRTFASGVNKALLSTGIGAFVVAIGAIAANWDRIKTVLSGVSQKQNDLLDATKKKAEIDKTSLESLDTGLNILKLQGKSEREILEAKIKTAEVAIESAREELAQQQKIAILRVENEKRNRELLIGMLTPVKLILATIENSVKGLGKIIGQDWSVDLQSGFEDLSKWATSWIADPDEVSQEMGESVKAADDRLRELQDKWAGYQLDLKKMNADANTDYKKSLEEKEQLTKESLDREKEMQAQSFADRLAMQQNAIAAVQAFDDEFQKGLNEIDSKRAEVAQLNYDNELAAAERTIFRKLELEREGLEAKRQQEVEYAESIGADTYYINEKYQQADLELEKAKQDAKLSLAADFAGNIATIAGEGTAIGKAAAVAQTTVSTYQAATGAYASLAAIPVVGPALGIAAAAAAVAAGFANVKKILAVDSGLPGGSKGGAKGSGSISTGTGGGSTAMTNIAPSINQGIISRQTIEQNQNQIVLQPTLVIDDVTSKQNSELSKAKTSTI